jgi:hypothetical protein
LIVSGLGAEKPDAAISCLTLASLPNYQASPASLSGPHVPALAAAAHVAGRHRLFNECLV